jgi:uncharacterized membrane protein
LKIGQMKENGMIATALTATAILCGLALRWVHLGGQSLWNDEGDTALASQVSPAHVVSFSRSLTYPPLYPLLQYYWGLLFGNSESALRGVSALSGTLSIPVFYLLAKKILQDRMAVALAMWLFAFSIMQVWYSREARFYELASLFALVSLYALVLFLERQSVTLFAIIVLSSTASLYTHNMMFFYFLALNVTWLTYPSTRTLMRRVKEVLLADVVAAILYLPWLPSLLAQITRVQAGFWAPKPRVPNLFWTFALVAGIYLDYLKPLVSRLLDLSSHVAWGYVLVGVSLLSAALVAGGLWRVPPADRNRNISLLLYCFLPVMVVFAVSLVTKPVYIDRVFVISSAVAPIILAYPLAAQKGRRRRIMYGLLEIAVGVVVTFSLFGYLRYQQKEDWRGATASLLNIPVENRLIVFVPASGKVMFDYYSQRFGAASTGPSTMRGDNVSAVELAVESRKYSEIDAVLYEESLLKNKLAFDYLSRVCVPLEERRFYQVRFVRFMMPSDPPQALKLADGRKP